VPCALEPVLGGLVPVQPTKTTPANNNALTRTHTHTHAQASVDALMLKLESLQAQMEEGRQLSSERITALLEDRRIREGEEAVHREAMNAQLDAQVRHLLGLLL
jgi:hypothetical protein